MDFQIYANEIEPFIGGYQRRSEYFVDMISHFIDESAINGCAVLNVEADTQEHYLNGKPKIRPSYAKYMYEHRNLRQYSNWLSERFDMTDSYDLVAQWLTKNEIRFTAGDEPDACAELLESIMLERAQTSRKRKKADNTAKFEQDLLKDIEMKLAQLPKPPEVKVPDEEAPEEHRYVGELFSAYADAEGMPDFTKSDLESFPEYAEDFSDRRIEYYSAVSIQRGVLELGEELSGQFDVLKDETYAGVRDTARQKYGDGYERMLAVLKQAVSLHMEAYILSRSPYWISNEIKMGACHHLVNDGKLKWVKRRNVK